MFSVTINSLRAESNSALDRYDQKPGLNDAMIPVTEII